MVTLQSVFMNVQTAQGTQGVWSISANEHPYSDRGMASHLNLSERSYRQVLLVNGAIDMNGILCFDNEERCNGAISSLQAKIALPPSTHRLGSLFDSPMTTRASSSSADIRVEVVAKLQDIEDMILQYIEENECEEFTLEDVGNQDLFEVFDQYFRTCLGVDTEHWHYHTIEYSVEILNNACKICFIGQV